MNNRSGSSVPKDLKRFHKGHVTARNERLRLMRDQRANKKESQDQGKNAESR